MRVIGEKLHLDYVPNNQEASDRLTKRWTEVLKNIDRDEQIIPFGIYPRNNIPLQAVGHQCGTCRFGDDPKTSVLDRNCRTHDVENLYVVDASFFPSSSAVNPRLPLRTRQRAAIARSPRSHPSKINESTPPEWKTLF